MNDVLKLIPVKLLINCNPLLHKKNITTMQNNVFKCFPTKGDTIGTIKYNAKMVQKNQNKALISLLTKALIKLIKLG